MNYPYARIRFSVTSYVSPSIEEFIAKNTVLECNTQTSRIYGEIKNQLRLKGRPLPENDIWIAAMSLQYNLILVTRNAHFQCLYS
jgi:tRNA(fMet)-specific endonuclease VapC